MSKPELHIQPTPQEIIVGDLRKRIKKLKGEPYPAVNQELHLLRKVLTLENKALKGEQEGFFSTGFAGRKGVHWEIKDGRWQGQLINRGSGVLKKEALAGSAEEMLRSLLEKQNYLNAII